jgi:hypothetical protein
VRELQSETVENPPLHGDLVWMLPGASENRYSYADLI